jgi:hypothetical protein
MTHYSNTDNPIDFPELSSIDKLWGEALDRAIPDTYSSLSWTQVEKIKAVFAELIVRECLGCCEQVISDPVPKSVDTWVNGGTQCIDEIKQHFGVEE